ncbi:MAG: iron-containing alcohol dehydrogenase, partial [Spirochaetaceae bacterium]|nr:iron-containing alcohol dehydrogenase [Spirochaetaceae bacterium]
GRGAETKVGSEAAAYAKKVLIHYGGGSVKKSGLYGRVVASLDAARVAYVDLGGVKPNPRLSLVREGIALCRKEGVGLVLALGGGSAIDSAKAIAAGVPYAGDVWDFFTGAAIPAAALPVGTVLTIPAAGSEASTGSVITKEEGWLKRAFNSDLVYPRFSALNPELAFTLPPAQVANGAADIMAHLIERYFTNSRNVEFTDRLIEATLRTVIDAAPRVLARPDDYDAWAELMWAGTIAHNNLLNTGREGCWGSHDIEHELSAIYDIAHGAGLAVVIPAWMRFAMGHDVARFAQFADRVWGVEAIFQDPERTARRGIERLEAFWASLGLATRLSGLAIGADRIDEMASKCTKDGSATVGHFVAMGKAEVAAILRLAL